MTSRLAVMAHFDPDGAIAPHALRHIEALRAIADHVVVVSTANLTKSARELLSRHATLIERPNYGYDFLSYRVGLAEGGEIGLFDEVVLCNDTFVGPLRPYPQIFAEMDARPVDFWGLTQNRRIAPHVQSFFVVFRPWVVASKAFTRFWADMIPLSDRKQVIHRYEVGMSARLLEVGFVAGSYFDESAEDEKLARRRMQWWAVHRPPGLTRRALRDGTIQRRAAESWNPTIALADQALPDGRLPFVKMDTLRYDPYNLGADSFLRRCEQTFPQQFAGVREFLDRTSSRYVRRAGEELLDTPLTFRPLSLAVRYAR